MMQPDEPKQQKMKNQSVSVKYATWDLLSRVSLHAGPLVGRRLTFNEVIVAALAVAQDHHEEMIPALQNPQTLEHLAEKLALRTQA